MAASEIVTDRSGDFSRVYFEARRDRHEDRFKNAGVIGVAQWRRNQFVGLRVADARAGPGVLITKPFSLLRRRMRMHVNLDARQGPCGNGSVLVELLDEHEQPLQGHVSGFGTQSIPLSNRISSKMRVLWQAGPPSDPTSKALAWVNIKPGAPMLARFTLSGTARLFGFRLLGVADAEGPVD